MMDGSMTGRFSARLLTDHVGGGVGGSSRDADGEAGDSPTAVELEDAKEEEAAGEALS